ncbi:MAG: DUF3618 domain-containing protein [Actinomycetota bacterium]|jgi:Protein of unknown function (DUF3618)
MAQEPDAIRAEIAATRQRMGDAVEALAYKTDVKARARDKIDEVREIVSTATESFVESVREPLDAETRKEGASMSTNASSSTSSASSEGWEDEGGLLKRNPLVVAFGAAAIGFLAGLLVPSTPAENERLGPVADHVKQGARDAAQEAVGRGKAIAADAAVSATAAVKETTQNAVSESGTGSSSSGGSGSGSSGSGSSGGSGGSGASSSGGSTSGSSSAPGSGGSSSKTGSSSSSS